MSGSTKPSAPPSLWPPKGLNVLPRTDPKTVCAYFSNPVVSHLSSAMGMLDGGTSAIYLFRRIARLLEQPFVPQLPYVFSSGQPPSRSTHSFVTASRCPNTTKGSRLAPPYRAATLCVDTKCCYKR